MLSLSTFRLTSATLSVNSLRFCFNNRLVTDADDDDADDDDDDDDDDDGDDDDDDDDNCWSRG